jgi:hypothetical protein
MMSEWIELTKVGARQPAAMKRERPTVAVIGEESR